MTKNILIICAFLFILGSCKSPDKPLQEVTFQGAAQGTYYLLKYYNVDGRNLQPQIDSVLKAFDQSLSAWVPNSILSKVNRNEDVELDDYFIENFNSSMQISKETNGYFDCSLGPLIEAWGFGFREKILLTQERIDSLKSFIGFEKIRIENGKIIKDDPRMELSFNAIAQGYSVDLLGEFLETKNIKNYLINVGGEIITKGSKPDGSKWRVGIQKPTEDDLGAIEADVIVELTNMAFVTSGSYRKYYEKDGVRYSHMIDPHTGYPVTHTLLSVTVLAKNCMLADGYATAFMVMGLEKSLEFLENRSDLEAYFIFSDETGLMLSKATAGLKKMIVQ